MFSNECPLLHHVTTLTLQLQRAHHRSFAFIHMTPKWGHEDNDTGLLPLPMLLRYAPCQSPSVVSGA